MEENDRAHLEQIVELIDHIERRLGPLDRDTFVKDRDEVDLTAFRLAAIGEASRKLSSALKARHPAVAWSAMYAMRNIITHDYGAILPERVWEVPGESLALLRQVCSTELKALQPE